MGTERLTCEQLDGEVEALLKRSVAPYQRPFLRRAMRLFLEQLEAKNVAGAEAIKLVMELALMSDTVRPAPAAPFKVEVKR